MSEAHAYGSYSILLQYLRGEIYQGVDPRFVLEGVMSYMYVMSLHDHLHNRKDAYVIP
jgi:hypothetical protein